MMILSAFVLTAGCTETGSGANENTIAVKTADYVNGLIASNTTGNTTDETSQVSETGTATPIPTVTQTVKETVTPIDSPKYSAGMLVTDEKSNLALITQYNPSTKKYAIRTVMKGSDGEAWLTKDSSFSQFGYSDLSSSIELRYPILFDDLNNDLEDFDHYKYDWKTKEGCRIHVYLDDSKKEDIGYLMPKDKTTMQFVHTIN